MSFMRKIYGGKMKENITIEQVFDKGDKKDIARRILEALPEWFEVEESREQLIEDSVEQIFVVAKDNDEPVGFACLKGTGKDTAELAVLGVLKEYHRKGIGTDLVEEARDIAKHSGFSFLQVKTVEMGKYEEYDKTNLFYSNVGFKEFEVFPTLWNEENPCQIYVMAL